MKRRPVGECLADTLLAVKPNGVNKRSNFMGLSMWYLVTT
jgi:hypothetical protein